MPQEELLNRAFQLTRRHPVLWLLALLAGEGASGGSYSSSGGSFSRVQQHSAGSPATPLLTAIGAWLLSNWTLLAIGISISLALGLVVSCLAAGALYRAQEALDSGANFGAGAAWAAARLSFWRLLGLRFLTALAFGAPYLLLGVLTFLMFLAGGRFALVVALLIDASFLVFLTILTVLAWPVLTFAARVVVLDGQRPVAALRSTLRLIGHAPGRVLLTAAIAIGLGIAVGVVFSLVDAVLTLPFASSLLDAAGAFDLERIWHAAFPLLVILVPVSLLLGAVAGSFYSAYWTFSFRNLGIEQASLRPARTP